jgi:hypothetical protein
MNKKIRILLAMVFFIAIVVAGTGAPAWAAKLNSGLAAPAGRGPDQGLSIRGRGHGTVRTTPVCIQTRQAGRFTVGSIAAWMLDTVADGQKYTACVIKPIDLPARLPGVPLTYPIKLIVSSGKTLGVDEQICFPVPPGYVGSAYYWDGMEWLQTEDSNSGRACITVPAFAPNPSYTGLAKSQ